MNPLKRTDLILGEITAIVAVISLGAALLTQPTVHASPSATAGNPVVSISSSATSSEGSVLIFTLTRTGDTTTALTVGVEARETLDIDAAPTLLVSNPQPPPEHVANTTLNPTPGYNRSTATFAAGSATTTYEVATKADDDLYQPSSWVVVKARSWLDAYYTIPEGSRTRYEVSTSGSEASTKVTNEDDLDRLISDGLTLKGATRPDYLEIRTGSVVINCISNIPALFEGDTRGISIQWSVDGGSDADDFYAHTQTGGCGRLHFISPPDYEDPTDSDTDNVYAVTFKAQASISSRNETVSRSRDVTVTVTDREETPATEIAWVDVRKGSIDGSETLDPDDPINVTEGNTLDVYVRPSSAPVPSSDGQFRIHIHTGRSPQRLEFPNTGVYATGLTRSHQITYSRVGEAWKAWHLVRITVLDDDTVDKTARLTFRDQFAAYDSASVEFTVNIADNDLGDGLAVSGIATTSYAENGTSTVATYVASGAADNATITWSLTGDDSEDFSISSDGELTFRSSPDYESAADSDGDNAYEVTVNASDGTNTATLDVTITVTDVNETPTLQDILNLLGGS